MSTEPTIDGVKALLNRKGLGNLVKEVEDDPQSFEDWKKRTEAQWEKVAGLNAGIDIYNYLNPRRQGLAENKTGGQSSSDSNLNAPHPKRKERWEKINEILGKNKKRSVAIDSTGYSYVKWSELKIVFETTPYVQSLKAIPDREFSILSQYLSFATKCFGPITSGNESQRLHLIAPIIICVCILFNGDVQIKVEEDLVGDFLKAHGHFEFVLCRGNKRVCIVEAKKDDMEQGMAQDLLGCEVAAEVDHSDSVFGIVTNYIQWNFLRSLDEKIELEECAMDITGDGPVQTSLLKITSKIYAMLSDD